jgi:hypothetical protein
MLRYGQVEHQVCLQMAQESQLRVWEPGIGRAMLECWQLWHVQECEIWIWDDWCWDVGLYFILMFG